MPQRKDPTLNDQSLPAAPPVSAAPAAPVSGPTSLWAAALSLGAAAAALVALLPLAAAGSPARAADAGGDDEPDDARLRDAAAGPAVDDEDAGGNVVAIEQGRARRNRRAEAEEQRAGKREERAGVRQEKREERAGAKEQEKAARAERAQPREPRPVPANRAERLEQREERASQKEERASQREERKQARKAEPAPVLEAIAPRPAGDGAAAAPSPADAAPMAEAAAAETGSALVPAQRSTMLVAPLMNTAAQSQRAIDRARNQLDAAEQAVQNAGDLTATIAPLIRHVNSVTEQLNEAHMAVGRLTAERDALRARLATAEGVSVEELGFVAVADGHVVEARAAKLQRLDARAERHHEPVEEKKPHRILTTLGIAAESDSDEHFKIMTRRRQVLAAAVLLTIFLVMRFVQSNGGSTSGFSRDSLAEIQGVGSLMQVFIVCWMLYRIVRVGGRGVRWVFPSNSNTKRRRH